MVEGNNVFAVEVHNDSLTSTDIGFDAQLTLGPADIVVPLRRTVAQGGWYIFDDLPRSSVNYPTDTARVSRAWERTMIFEDAVGTVIYSLDSQPLDTDSGRSAGTVFLGEGGNFTFVPAAESSQSAERR